MKDKNIFYSCPYCKEEYTEPGDLARCILSCEEKKRIEEEKTKKTKLEAEKQKRYDEVVDVYKQFDKLKSEYIDDYGSFVFKTCEKIPNLYEFLFGNI